MVDRQFTQFMERALTLAARGRGNTSPNPMVGAVVVKRGRIIAEGYHRRAGADHAEIVALKRAGHLAWGSTLVVSLEPCCHTGRTGPCTQAIIESGISRVVYATNDPDPRVDGQGATVLRRAGVIVEKGLLGHEARTLNEAYFCYHTKHRPFVVLKTAQSIDGRIATATGDSKWISGHDALVFAHRLRAEADAVVVGMGTVIADNPALTVRHVAGANPYRIVVTRSMSFPRHCQLLEKDGDLKTIVASSRRSLSRFGTTRRRHSPILWEITTNTHGLLDLGDLVTKARQFGFRSLLVEGGGKLATSFLKAGLVDKYIVVLAPMVIGEGVSSVGNLSVTTLSKSVKFDKYEFLPCGKDYLFVGYPSTKR
ncbi:MAG: bifunctional diaminohydroxyphosphoribosylaminopyrimidine deaminase/5-amino-6-(5-phosphoribosylamino)uracil reductase RibD [Candidatus Zixiibacteriota bacterium]